MTLSTAMSSSSVSSVHDASKEDSSIEKGYFLELKGIEDEELPNKIHGHYLRNVRHQIFTLYRRLFGIVLVTNLGIFIAALIKSDYNTQSLGVVVIANLFCAILMRQEYVINAFFVVFCSIPSSWPLWLRRICARVYHIGGLHSGCAISGTLWFMFFTAKATSELFHGGKSSVATVILSYIILILLLGIIGFAHPKLREILHDRFEQTHRFFGWTTVALVWALVVSLSNDYRAADIALGNALIKTPVFWLLLILTFSIALPWVVMKKHSVRTEVLSEHAVRIYFDYNVNPVPGSFIRVSENPLTQWHAFATIAEPGVKGYSIVVSRAGDWTSKHIDNAPTSLWVRGIPTCGALRVVPLFRRIVLVATGSGIGPCAPHLFAKKLPIRLLWVAPNTRKTFGDKLVDSILEASSDAIIYDTRVHGKPDMVKLTYHIAKEFEAEAVCIISNRKLTFKLVYGLTSRGIPAFGPIWDS